MTWKKFPILHLRKTNEPAGLGRPSHPGDDVSPLVGISSTHVLNGPILFSDRQVSCQELTAWCKYAILQLPLPSALFKCTKNKYCSSPKWHKGNKKYNSSSPSPSRVSASTSRLTNSIAFSARGRNRFKKHSVLLELSGSVKTAKETLDTTSANWMIRGTEFLCFKEKRLLNYFSFFQLSKVILLSLQNGYSTAAAAAQALLHNRTELKFMQDNSDTRCSGSEMQDWAERWPNCSFSCIKRIELVCSPLTNALQNTSFEMEGHDTSQNLSMWGPQVPRNQAPNWKQRPHWKGWNKSWFTAGFILCTSCMESTNLRSIYCTLIANVDIHKMPLH